jgi:AcrR family transcriptional regulator
MAHATRQPLSRERILAAGIAVADAEGLDAVSMRHVGERLGVEAMSLYRHVANKDDLLDGMVDEVVATFPVASLGGDWRDRLGTLVRGAHEVLVAHPWAPTLATARAAVGPGRLRFVDGVVGILLSAGCSPQLAHDALHAVEVHVFAFTLQELRLRATRGGYALDHLPAGAEAHPSLAVTLAEATHDHSAEFDFVLELLMVGIERAIATTPR